jgi:nitroreductase
MVVEWMRSLIRENSPLAQAMHLEAVVAACDQGSDRICRGAPHLVVAHGRQANRAAPAACIIGLAYLELAAFARGLGTCWAGYFSAAASLWAPLQQALALPEGHTSFGAMMVGKARFAYRRLPRRRKARITWR